MFRLKSSDVLSLTPECLYFRRMISDGRKGALAGYDLDSIWKFRPRLLTVSPHQQIQKGANIRRVRRALTGGPSFREVAKGWVSSRTTSIIFPQTMHR